VQVPSWRERAAAARQREAAVVVDKKQPEHI
jgi:hypothetical protein